MLHSKDIDEFLAEIRTNLEAVQKAELGSDEALDGLSSAMRAVTAFGEDHIHKRFNKRISGPIITRAEAVAILEWLERGVKVEGWRLQYLTRALQDLDRGKVHPIVKSTARQGGQSRSVLVEVSQDLAGLAFEAWQNHLDSNEIDNATQVKRRFGTARTNIEAWKWRAICKANSDTMYSISRKMLATESLANIEKYGSTQVQYVNNIEPWIEGQLLTYQAGPVE